MPGKVWTVCELHNPPGETIMNTRTKQGGFEGSALLCASITRKTSNRRILYYEKNDLSPQLSDH